MPRIPTYQSSAALPGQSAGLEVSPTILSGPGRALERIGATLFEGELRRTREEEARLEVERGRQQRLADATWLHQQLGPLERDATIEWQRRLNEGDPSEPGFTEQFLTDWYNPRQAAALASRPQNADGNPLISEEAVQALNERIAALKNDFAIEGLRVGYNAAHKKAVDTIDGSINAIAATARRGGPIEGSLANLDAMLNDFGKGIDANTWRDQRAKGRQAVIVSAVLGMIDNEDFNGARAVLKSGQYDQDLEPNAVETLTNQIQQGERHREALRRAAIAETKANLVGQWDLAKDRASNGFATDPATLQALLDGFRAVGDEARAAAVSAIIGAQGTLEELRAKRPDEVQQYAIELRQQISDQGNQPTLAQLELLRGVERLYGTMLKLAEHDLLELAGRSGNFNVAPLVLEGDTAEASIKARIATAEAAAEHYGRQPQYLTGQERDVVVNLLSDTDPMRRLAIIDQIHRAFGPRADRVLAEIAPKEPVMAYIAGLAGMGPTQAAAAVSALRGDQLERAGGKVAWSEPDARAVEASELGEAMSLLGTTRAAAIATARKSYLDRMTRAGRAGDDFDRDEYASALQAAVARDSSAKGLTGGVGEGPRGERLVLPRGLTQDDFEAVLEGLTDQDLIEGSLGGGVPMSARGAALTAEVLRDHGRLHDYGDGTYLVTIEERFVVGTAPGGVYALELGRLAPRVLGRSLVPPP